MAKRTTDFNLTAPAEPETSSQKAVAAVKQIHDAQAASVKPANSLGTITLAGSGKKVDVSAFHLDHDYIASSGRSFFGEAARHLKDPKKGHMYVWAGISKMHKSSTMSKIRSKQYRPVEEIELKDESDLPYETHRLLTRAGKEVDVVAIHDLILCEVHPKAVRELYHNREAQAALRVAEGNLLQHAMNTHESATGSNVVAQIGDLPSESMVQLSLKARDKSNEF